MRKLLVRVASSLLAVLLTLALLEAVMRVPALRESVFRSTAIPSHESPAIHTYRFSETTPPTQEKPPGTYRVLVLGDSFTWGAGVLADDSYPDRLERRLLHWQPDWRFEVINAGRRGRNTVDECRWLLADRLLDRFAPDLLILGYCLNDTEPTDKSERRRVRRLAMRHQPTEGASGWFHAHSELYRFVFGRLENSRQRKVLVDYYRSGFQQDSPEWQDAVAALATIRDHAAEHSTPLLVVVFPIFDSQLDDSYAYRDLHETVVRTCRELGIEVLDLLPHYEGIDARRLALEPFTDPHPSELAHRIAAQHIFEYVKDLLERQAAAASADKSLSPAP